MFPVFCTSVPPYYYRFGEGRDIDTYNLACIKELEQTIIYEGAESVAAIIIEPIISGGGVIVPPTHYLRMVREICDRYGILLIFDEVVNGFGRTGKMFGHQHWGVQPDVITFAKGITSGYMPLGATVVQQHVFEAFLGEPGSDSHFRHVTTFGGSPVCAAVANRNIEIIESEKLSERAADMGNYLMTQLEKLLEYPHVGDVRGQGLLLGIELVQDRQTKEPVAGDKIAAITKQCMEKGVIVGRNTNTIPGFTNVLILAPPLVLGKEQADFLVAVLTEAIRSMK